IFPWRPGVLRPPTWPPRRRGEGPWHERCSDPPRGAGRVGSGPRGRVGWWWWLWLGGFEEAVTGEGPWEGGGAGNGDRLPPPDADRSCSSPVREILLPIASDAR